jgi:hypothetical protein
VPLHDSAAVQQLRRKAMHGLLAPAHDFRQVHVHSQASLSSVSFAQLLNICSCQTAACINALQTLHFQFALQGDDQEQLLYNAMF